MEQSYFDRFADGLIAELLSGLPAVLVVGPRACGKTTTAKRHARTVVRLDREEEAAVVRADPDGALSVPRPVLLDEWQMAPQVLGAVKRAVDERPGPNCFLITGSVRTDLTAQGWPATGRVVRVEMHGLTQREITGGAAAVPALDRIAEEGVAALRAPAERYSLNDYLALALRGGFPEAVLAPSERLRRRWLRSYVSEVVTRDADLVDDGGRDPHRLRRYLHALCVNTAGVVDAKSLYDAAGIDRKTALAYDRLLTNLYVVDAVPSWWSNRLKRLVKAPKRYIVDPAVAGSVLRLDPVGLRRDADLLGRVLDTYVMSQLRAEVSVCESEPTLHHLRVADGRHEIDLLVEYGDGAVFGFEIKAGGAPGTTDARHLAWLRDELGDRFLGGAVLHTGPHLFPLGDRIIAAPISALWTT